ncbi:hypothetical protein ACROYT_G019104 [Oculina patagonica]
MFSLCRRKKIEAPEEEVGTVAEQENTWKQRLRSSLSKSERAKLLKMKAQMEQQIQALEEQIILEKHALIDRSNRLQQLVKSLNISSPEINKLAEQRATSLPAENESEQSEAPDLPQSNDSESQRLMREACQFAQFLREHPLEKWTVGSLPNLPYL